MRESNTARTWNELADEEKELFDWVDLEPGETMSEWWDAYCEVCREEGSDPLDMKA